MTFNRIKRRWRALFHRDELERELDAELRFHLERETAQNLQSGMKSVDAYYSALKAFGGLEQSKEECRDARGVRLIEEFRQDLRYAARLLAKNPGFTLIALLTLALGIGANTAIFSVVNAFLLRPLPYGKPEQLMIVDSQYRGQSSGVSFLDYEDWRKQNHVFEDLAFFNLRWNANLQLGSETETLNLTFATANLFSTLQVAPLLGHGPAAGDSDTVLISHGLWQIRFGSDPNIVGRQLRIDGHGLTVIGVMPPDFRFPFQSDLWWLNDRYFNRQNRGGRIDQSFDIAQTLAISQLREGHAKKLIPARKSLEFVIATVAFHATSKSPWQEEKSISCAKIVLPEFISPPLLQESRMQRLDWFDFKSIPRCTELNLLTFNNLQTMG